MGAVLAEGEVSTVHISEELLRVRGEGSRLAWSVTYTFQSSSTTAVDAAFPVTTYLQANPKDPGADREALAVILDALAAGPEGATWTGVAASARHNPDGVGCADCLALAAVARSGKHRVRLAPSRLAALGIRDFQMTLDAAPVPIGQLSVEVDPTPARADFGHPWLIEDEVASGLTVTVLAPVELVFPAGTSTLRVTWTSSPWSSEAWDESRWQAAYDFSPARSWAGPIDRLWVAIDRELFRTGVPPTVPGVGPIPVGEDLVWSARDWEPAADAQLQLGGESVWPFGPIKAENYPYPMAKRAARAVDRGGVPLLPWSTVQTSSVADFPNPVPWLQDGISIHDMGFAGGHAVDGAIGSAWCSGGPSGTATFTLPADATGLSVFGGQRNRWRLAALPCRDPDSRAYWNADGSRQQCFVEALGATAVPGTGTLTGGGAETPLVFDAQGVARVDRPLSDGSYTVAVEGTPDGHRGVCIAEIVPDIVTEPRLSALLAGG